MFSCLTEATQATATQQKSLFHNIPYFTVFVRFSAWKAAFCLPIKYILFSSTQAPAKSLSGGIP